MTGKGNSSPGHANLRIGTQAGHDQDSHPDPQQKYALRYSSSISPTHDAVIAPFRRYVHLPAPSLYTPALRPPFGVIPAKAGILTRVALDEGRAVVVNCAGIPSRHFSFAKCVELCAQVFGVDQGDGQLCLAPAGNGLLNCS